MYSLMIETLLFATIPFIAVYTYFSAVKSHHSTALEHLLDI